MNIEQRINRIVGQLKGIQRMVGTGRDCVEILQQISAVKKAIDGLSREIVVTNISGYLAKEDSKKIERVLERAISL